MNQQIIVTIISTFSTIIAAVLSALVKAWVGAYLKENPPVRKKHPSVIKKSLIFSLRYILLIASIIYYLVAYKNADKVFVVAVSFQFFVLSIIAAQDIALSMLRQFVTGKKEMLDKHFANPSQMGM
jgi:hypothetical protein